MAGSLQTFATLKNPNANPSPSLHGVAEPRTLCRLSFTPFLHVEPARRPLGLSAKPLPWRSSVGRLISAERRTWRLVPFAASEESNSEIEVEKKNEESQEAWQQRLEYFKAEALKVKAMSEEAYEVYSKKAMEALLDTAEKLKIQTEKAKQDLSIIANEINEEGKEYLSTAAQHDSVKEIIEICSSLPKAKNIDECREYSISTIYGISLALGGFTGFMFTGSVASVRFGIILGLALLAVSVAAHRSWKIGKPSELLKYAQALLASVAFLRALHLFHVAKTIPNFLLFLITGAIEAFYIYRIVTDIRNKGKSIGQSSEN